MAYSNAQQRAISLVGREKMGHNTAIDMICLLNRPQYMSIEIRGSLWYCPKAAKRRKPGPAIL
jgi:hypothetical protein